MCDNNDKAVIEITNIPEKLPSIKSPDFYEQFEIYYTNLPNKKYFTKRNNLNNINIEAATMMVEDKWCDCEFTNNFREFPNINNYLNSLKWKYVFENI